LVYTGQPWHPQLEFIARALNNHRGEATWVMRRRSQAEMDELVARAGFRKLDQRIDEMGIFTVSLAQRIDAS
ncbi:class I SAM-dependent methyltransferase family protein, partial [Escherichia coli]|nr:class I SAM-dependent methyltransferase family protein [Escherichia coli]